MKQTDALDDYSVIKALERIKGLSKKKLKTAIKLTELFDDDNCANVKKIHDELYAHLTRVRSASAALGRLIDGINMKAKKTGIPLKCCVTSSRKCGAVNRRVWFEGESVNSALITDESKKLEKLEKLEKAINISIIDRQAALRSKRYVIVILTFNEREKNAIIKKFAANTGLQTLKKSAMKGLRLGKHGDFRVVLLHHPSRGALEAQAAATGAWKKWKPVAILNVGIGYGAHPSKQKPGEVLISEGVQDCNNEKIEDGTTIPHGSEYMSSHDLYESISHLNDVMEAKKSPDWPKLHFGKILSENVLNDNFDYLKKRLESHPNAIGGEMEGAGLAKAAHKCRFEWILIKGISSFAKDKDRNKGKRQIKAAENAAKIVYELLRADTTFGRRFTRTLPELMADLPDIDKIRK